MKIELRRCLFIFLIAGAALIVSAYPSCAQSAPQTDTARKQSIVHGRVIYDDTRRPLRRIHVSIYDPAAKNKLRGYFAWTDGRGEFQIKDVAAGNYFVVVDAPGIIRKAPYNADNNDETFASVTVDGTSKSEVVVRVRRGAAISGRITYADGDPAIETAIKVLRKKDGRWTPVSVNTGSNDRALTDDRGVYRVAGLEPGEYIVGAAEQKWGVELSAQDRPDGTNLLNRAALPATYYNGVTSLSGATPITVQAGDEQKDIDIVLADRPMHTISGSVTLKDNSRPVGRARISLKRRDEPGASDLEDPVTNTDENGRFVFNEIPDGLYSLTVSPPRWFSRAQDSPTGAELGPRFVAKTIEANVSGVDLPDLAIEVSSGSRISGTVSVEGGKPVPPQLQVYVTTKKTAAEGPSSVRIDPDATFTIEGVPHGP
ncbi:MAG: MSCRAMM family protein, partial [Pyrinomonadaceae bacterium]